MSPSEKNSEASSESVGNPRLFSRWLASFDDKKLIIFEAKEVIVLETPLYTNKHKKNRQ